MRGLDLDTATDLLSRARQAARNAATPPMAFVALDTGGLIKAVACEDGTGTMRFAIAEAKAATALGMGVNTRVLYDRFEQGLLPERFSAAVNGATQGRFTPQPGGLLLYRDDTLLGALGVSGSHSDEDEAIALAAIQQAGLTSG